MVGGYCMPIPFDIDYNWNEEDVTERFGGIAEFNKVLSTLMKIQPQKPYLLNMRGNSGRYAQWANATFAPTEIIFDMLGGNKVTFNFTANNVTCTVNQ